MTTDPRTLISDTADALADVECSLRLDHSLTREQLDGLAGALRIVIAVNREWLADQERSEPIQQPEVADSDYGAFEALSRERGNE